MTALHIGTLDSYSAWTAPMTECSSALRPPTDLGAVLIGGGLVYYNEIIYCPMCLATVQGLWVASCPRRGNIVINPYAAGGLFGHYKTMQNTWKWEYSTRAIQWIPKWQV